MTVPNLGQSRMDPRARRFTQKFAHLDDLFTGNSLTVNSDGQLEVKLDDDGGLEIEGTDGVAIKAAWLEVASEVATMPAKTFNFGNGTDDVTINFDGGNDCAMKWWEDEQYLSISCKVLMQDAVYFTQTDGAERIDSTADGVLDIYAGTRTAVHGSLYIINDIIFDTDFDNKIELDGTDKIVISADLGVSVASLGTFAVSASSDVVIYTEDDMTLSSDLDLTIDVGRVGDINATSNLTISSGGPMTLTSAVGAYIKFSNNDVRLGIGSGDPVLTFDSTSDGTITWDVSASQFEMNSNLELDGQLKLGSHIQIYVSESLFANIIWRNTSGQQHWALGRTNGDNDFFLARFWPSGTNVGNVFTIYRDTGNMDFNHDLTITGNLTVEDDTEIHGTFKAGDPDGTDYFEVEADGTVKFNGAATVWDDVRVPAQNTKLNPANSEPAFEEFTDGLYVYKFDTSNGDTESIHFVVQMPHSYKEGSDIYPHLHWSPDNTDTGNVRWQFEYIVANIDGTFAATATSETITEAADGTARKHQVAAFSAIDGTNLTISHLIICRLTRLSSSDAADTFTGNACFLEFDFHYEKDTIGSRQEYVK